MVKKWKLFRGLTTVFCCLFALILCITLIGKKEQGAVSSVLGGGGSSVEVNAENIVYKSDFTEDGVPTAEGLEKLLEAEYDYIETVSEEGSVLLKNDNAALPLAEKSNVTLFGSGFRRSVFRGISNGAVYDSRHGINAATALKSVFNVNEDVLSAYQGTNTNGGTDGVELTADQKATFTDYNDAAIVMLTRLGGESEDMLPWDELAGPGRKEYYSGGNQLALNDNEKLMLSQVRDGNFKKRIVLLNTGYPMELEELKDYDIDAIMWIGYPGLTGFHGVANLLCGRANPSGRLTDTYAASTLSSAAMQNFGNFSFEGNNKRYLIYAEGIYVGYKYYETRYEDSVLDRFNATGAKGVYASADSKWNYADEITYPFGYGLSYTTFTQEFDGESSYDAATDAFTVNVKVTNTGDFAGKSVVQVYAQVPYIERGVEKSAIQMAGYGKTGVLEPGADETVTVTIDRYLLASYDINARGGVGGYILDAGDYYLAVGDNAHDALNNVLAAKGAMGMYDQEGNAVSGNADKTWKYTLDERDEESYRLSDTGAEVNNKFTGDPLYATDYNEFETGDTVTYLTRSDWNTFPQTYENLAITDQMIKIHDGDFLEDIKPGDVPDKSEIQTGVTGEESIKFYQMHGVPLTGTYTDANGTEWDAEELWDKFLSQMSLEDMASVTADNFGIQSVDSVALPQITNQDGPDGIKGTYTANSDISATLYNSVNLLASTYNHELIRLRGYYTGEDGLYTGVSQYWGTGFNNHRTPYGGRNFEYVSEDSILSYYFAADLVPAMQEKGVICAPKHLAANDQETNRSGVMTFMTEQALRETSLRSFESAYTIGHAKSTMTSYNAIGACFTARNGALMNEVVRGEWGHDGIFITDAGSCSDTPLLTLATGTDMFCLGGSMGRNVVNDVQSQPDGYGLQVLRESNKRFFYVYSNSLAVNGLEEDTDTSSSMPWWLATLVSLDVVFAAAAVISLGMFVYTGYIRKKEGTGNV